jgi:hypothetical protein
MKKLFVLFVTIAVFGFAGTAMAAFSFDHLGAVAYDPTGDEVIVDLGLIGTDFNFTDPNAVLGNIANINAYTDVAAYGNSFPIFGSNQYFATNTPSAPGYNGAGAPSFDNASANMRLRWDDGVPHSTSDDTSWNTQFVGPNYAGVNLSPAPLAPGDLLYIYNYDLGQLVPGMGTDYLATLLIDATSGDVILNPGAEVPVPAAVWLLGSGLLALFGIRRQKV